jgi:hypothetical protein
VKFTEHFVSQSEPKQIDRALASGGRAVVVAAVAGRLIRGRCTTATWCPTRGFFCFRLRFIGSFIGGFIDAFIGGSVAFNGCRTTSQAERAVNAVLTLGCLWRRSFRFTTPRLAATRFARCGLISLGGAGCLRCIGL